MKALTREVTNRTAVQKRMSSKWAEEIKLTFKALKKSLLRDRLWKMSIIADLRESEQVI